MKKWNSTHMVLFAACLIVSVFAACEIIPPEPELPHSENDGMYSFNESTVYESIQRGDLAIFTPIPNQIPSPIPTSPDRVPIGFQELLQLSENFHRWKWKEAADNWELFELQYQVNCDSVGLDPSFLGVTLFKIEDVEGKNVRAVHKILMGHPQGAIQWFESERYPINEDWPSFDYKNLDASSIKDLLKIAEKNGGQTARLSVTNDCVINIIFAPYLSTNEWVVRYFQGSSSSTAQRYLLELYIDKTTGEIKIIPPK